MLQRYVIQSLLRSTSSQYFIFHSQLSALRICHTQSKVIFEDYFSFIFSCTSTVYASVTITTVDTNKNTTRFFFQFYYFHFIPAFCYSSQLPQLCFFNFSYIYFHIFLILTHFKFEGSILLLFVYFKRTKPKKELQSVGS